jgi:multidrug efflux pump subunit AcrA (membrane-fusion protein)
MATGATIYRHLGTVILPLVLGSLSACSPGKEEVVFPTRKTLTESVYASGLIKATNQYEAFAMGSGTIQSIFVSEGDTVAIGTPLFQLINDTERLQRESSELARTYASQQSSKNRLKELDLATKIAKSKYQSDSLLLEKKRRLWAQAIGTAYELEQQELAVHQALTSYEQAKLAYLELTRELAFSEQSAANKVAISNSLETNFLVNSKVNGLVFSILKKVGELATPQTALAILGDYGTYNLELQVDEYDITKIKEGQRIQVTLDSFKEQVFEAKVIQIHPILNTKSKTFTVIAQFVTAPPSLFPNLSLEANIITQIRLNALVIPRNLLLGQDRVLTQQGDTLRIQVGIKTYDFVEVLGGIEESTALILPIK